MKIKNNGKKIIHIGKKTLMPGEELAVTAKAAEAPAVRILVKHGVLTVSDDEASNDEASAAAAQAETDAEAAQAEADAGIAPAETGTDAASAEKEGASAKKTSTKKSAAKGSAATA